MNIRTSNLKDPVKDKAALQLVFCSSSCVHEVFFPPKNLETSLQHSAMDQVWITVSGNFSVLLYSLWFWGDVEDSPLHFPA